MNKHSILIIDDEETDRYLLKRLLKKIKITCKVFEATDGKEALDFFLNEEKNLIKYSDSYPPTIIFLDINMPILIYIRCVCLWAFAGGHQWNISFIIEIDEAIFGMLLKGVVDRL